MKPFVSMRYAATPEAAIPAVIEAAGVPMTAGAPAARPLELQAAGVTLGHTYPLPIVQHDEARKKTLERYAVVKAAAP